MRRRLNRNRCVVCGKPPAGHTGYVYYKSGRTRLYAPFCKVHLDRAPKYAIPVFRNQEAVDSFRQMFPVTYLQKMKSKPIPLFSIHTKQQKQTLVEVGGNG